MKIESRESPRPLHLAATLVAGGAALALGLGACAAGAGSRAAAPAPRAPLVVQSEPLAPPPLEGVLPENLARDTGRVGRTARPVFVVGEPVGAPELAADRAAARARSLAARAERRAYDGAPPVMPHSADFGAGSKGCLDCHGEGFELDELVARPMSHVPLAGCTQCHVEAASPWLEGTPPPTENAFAGRPSPGPGARAAPGAPPTIPHALAMRGHCLACHGELGWEGLRTDHPWRANCVQCHVSSAAAAQLSPAFPAAPPP